MITSTDPRHNARRVVLGTLFCDHFLAQNDTSHLDACFSLSQDSLELKLDQVDNPLSQEILVGVTNNITQIDGIISQCAPDWPIDKISKVDLIILRIAVFEIVYDNKAPDKVVIDEAIELAKEFGGDTASKFVNGVLGTVVEVKKQMGSKGEQNDTKL